PRLSMTVLFVGARREHVAGPVDDSIHKLDAVAVGIIDVDGAVAVAEIEPGDRLTGRIEAGLPRVDRFLRNAEREMDMHAAASVVNGIVAAGFGGPEPERDAIAGVEPDSVAFAGPAGDLVETDD